MIVIGFDFDNTLVNTFDPYCRIHKHIATEMGLAQKTRKELIWFGNGWEDTLTKLYPGINVSEFLNRFFTLLEQPEYATHPIPGVPEAIRELHANHILAILSNAPRRNFEINAEHGGIQTELFDTIICQEDWKYRKPHPRSLEPLIIKYREKNVLYVGDMVQDYLGAKNSHIPFIGITSGLCTEQEFLEAGLPLERIINSVPSLPAFLHSSERI